MNLKRIFRFAVLLCAASSFTLSTSTAQAEEPLKIGVIAGFSGPFAEYGKLIEGGMRAYMKLNGDTVAGRKVEIITRDTRGPNAEVSKQLAQGLVVRDKVDFIVGFGQTPEALAATAVAEAGKKPMVVMAAAGSIITTKSKYVTRTSMTLPQVTSPIATWALKSGIKKVVTLVSDFGPGIDAETEFKRVFTGGGGQIMDSLRTPLNSPDFSPFLMRIKDLKPDAVFVFIPAGEQSIAVMKAYRERGLAEAGIKIIATGDLTDDHVLAAMGDSALGVITSFHYSVGHNSPENKAFLKAFKEVAPTAGTPSFMALGAYDGMHAIYDVVKKLNGKTDDPDKIMEAFKGLSFESPRGPIRIDPETRDIIQTVYIRKVEKVNGELVNVEFDKIADVKDPGKESGK